jgi:hypothetical protein
MDSDDDRVALLAMQSAGALLDFSRLTTEQIAVLVEITRAGALMPADPDATIDAPGDVRGGDR